MTAKEAKRLKIGNKVELWHCEGEVREMGHGGLLIAWEDGKQGWLDYRDCDCLVLSSGKVQFISASFF